MLQKVGASNVQTYIQSGNAVFDTRLDAEPLKRGIERSLERAMGRPIDTTLRDESQMKSIVAANPFPEKTADPARLCITFLSATPTATELAQLRERDWSPELVHVAGQEI